LQSAVDYGERALVLANTVGSRPLQIVVNLDLGVTYYTRGAYRQAVNCFRWAVEHFEGDPLRERFGTSFLAAVTAHGWLAFSLAALGEFHEATTHRAEAIRLAEAAGPPLSLTGAYNNSGLVYIEQGAFELACTVLERGIAVAEANDLPFRARLMSAHLGHAYAQTGRVVEGVVLLEQSIEQFASMAHPAYQSLRAGWLGDAYLLAGRLVDARRLAEQAVDLAVRYGELGHQARAVRVLADVDSNGEPPVGDENGARYREAMTLAEELEMWPLQARCHLGLGKLYGRIGRRDDAHAELTTAVAMLREMGMTFWLQEAEAELARVSASASGGHVG
jgi:tetratricopeptide (TPR) repeat protein